MKIIEEKNKEERKKKKERRTPVGGWFVKYDAGNVEYNNAQFNASTSATGSSDCCSSGAVSECLKELFEDDNLSVEDKNNYTFENNKLLDSEENRDILDKLRYVVNELEKDSPVEMYYDIEDTYEDSNSKWTTITCKDPVSGDELQVLSTADWLSIAYAKNNDELDSIVSNIKSDSFFRQIYETEVNESLDSSLLEKGTSRLRSHIIDSDEWAIVSPYRSERSDKENREMMSKLKSDVRKLGLGFIQFVSRWVEYGEAFDEESLLIPNMKLRDALRFGNKYNQSSIIVKSGEECREICTTPFEGHNVGDTVRTFNLNSKTPMNIETAENIFAKREGGASSRPKKGGRPFRLSEVYEVEQPSASCFNTDRRLKKVF